MKPGIVGVCHQNVPSEYDIMAEIERDLDGDPNESPVARDDVLAMLRYLAELMLADPAMLTVILGRIHFPHLSYRDLTQIVGYGRNEISEITRALENSPFARLVKAESKSSRVQRERRDRESAAE